jgi:hypothetical protein
MFPLPVFALPLDWTMTFEAVKENYDAVLGWTRMPGPGYRQSLENGFWFWFKPWIISYLRSADFFRLIVLPSSFFILVWFLVARHSKSKKAACFFIWTFSSIVYWFLSAPDMRFGSGFFFVCLGAAFLFAAPGEFRYDLSGLWMLPKIRAAFFYLWGICIIGMLGRAALSPDRNLVSIGRLQSLPVKEYTVPADPPFSVWIPADDKDDRTGNSLLPSTPYKPTNLEMREPGSLGKGFRPVKR